MADVTVSMSQNTSEAIGVFLLAQAEHEPDGAMRNWLKVVGRHLWGARDGEHIYLAGRESADAPVQTSN